MLARRNGLISRFDLDDCQELRCHPIGFWQHLGESGSIHQQRFPTADPACLIEAQVTITVQINGRARTSITLSPNAPEDEAVAIAQQTGAVQRHLNAQAVHRVGYVPGRILNFVTKSVG